MKIKKVLLTKWRGEYKENRPLAQEKEKKRKHFFFSSFCERFSPSPDKKWGKPLERERLFSSRTKEMEHEASYFRCDFSLLTSSTAFLFRCVFYAPEAYLTHFSCRYWLLNCSVQMGEGEEGAGHSKFTSSRFARCNFRAQKSLDFLGPLLPMVLEMDVARIKSLRPAPNKQQVH
jgi:hypothetical protein